MTPKQTLAVSASLKHNRYHIQRLLGQGGFGAVHLAQHLKKNTLYAIKGEEGVPAN